MSGTCNDAWKWSLRTQAPVVSPRLHRFQRVFGSMVRGDADDASDIDLLVSLPPEKTGLALGALLMDVQDLLQRRVGVVTEKSLHAALRDQILMEVQPL